MEEQQEVPSGIVYRSQSSGRIVSHGERVAAAKARVVADRRRGIQTEEWIVELAAEPSEIELPESFLRRLERD